MNLWRECKACLVKKPVKYSRLRGHNDFWVTLARGSHPFPSRTRKLSLSAPIVLHARVCGRLGSRPVINHKSPTPTGRAFSRLLNGFKRLQFHYASFVTIRTV